MREDADKGLSRLAVAVLGMIIGVAAVIGIAALGAGARDTIEARISASGANLLIVRAGNRTVGGVRLGMGSLARIRPLGGYRYDIRAVSS